MAPAAELERARRRTRVDRRLARESVAARRQLCITGALGVATAAAVVAQAALLAQLIARGAAGHQTLAQLRTPLVALAAVLVARALLAGGFELSGRLGATRVMSELRLRLVGTLLLARPGRRPHERTGELAAAAVQGVDSLEAYFAGYLPAFVLAAAIPVAVLAWVVPFDLAAAVTLALTVPVLVVFMVLIGKGAQARTRRRWRTLTLLSSHFLDVVRGLQTLKAHRREHAQAAVLDDVGQRYRRETMGTLRLAFLSALVLELCAMIGTALVAATVGLQLVDGELGLQAGLTVLLLAPELYAPLRAVGQQFHSAADGLAAAERLLDVLEQPPSVHAPASPVAAPDPASGPLRLERVSVRYPGRAAAALKEVTLELAPGRTTALVGPSGAGKSTLAALLLRLLDPSDGHVTCAGVELRDVEASQWQRRVAWVPQRARLFAGTIADNVALAEPTASMQRVLHALEQAGLGEFVRSLPHGVHTIVGDGGRRLSAGQAQRLALARAFLRDASLVVLDEPTANVDATTAAQLGEAIARLLRGRTALLITHDRALAAHAHRIVELRDGRLHSAHAVGAPSRAPLEPVG
jgi:thiol reductant ABC exporter CydD subunit